MGDRACFRKKITEEGVEIRVLTDVVPPPLESAGACWGEPILDATLYLEDE